MENVIGLIGLAGSGKDTAAGALTTIGYRIGSFAGRLKWLATQIRWDGHKDDRGRKLLQDLGTAVREYNSEYWIEWLKTESTVRNCKKVVISDVRFQNEADWVRSTGGIVIRIVRPEIIPMEHESELNQSEVYADYIVVNDSTIEELHNKIIEIVKSHDQALSSNAAV
jgi:dephospho-CoA kinase